MRDNFSYMFGWEFLRESDEATASKELVDLQATSKATFGPDAVPTIALDFRCSRTDLIFDAGGEVNMLSCSLLIRRRAGLTRNRCLLKGTFGFFEEQLFISNLVFFKKFLSGENGAGFALTSTGFWFAKLVLYLLSCSGSRERLDIV